MLDDLEGFKQLLKDTAAAWAELEKKSKKSRRKKNDGIWQYTITHPMELYCIALFSKCTL